MKNLCIILLLLTASSILAQEKGGPQPKLEPDTLIFNSPRPLISTHNSKDNVSYAYGGDFALTESGFGAGFSFHKYLSDDFAIFMQLYITGLRNTDEFESYNTETNRWEVPGKINRLFRFPLMAGGQYFPFRKTLTESLQPFIAAGLGPTFILSTPYELGWFEAFGEPTWYTKMGAFVGIGAYSGNILNSVVGVNIRYLYVPTGSTVIESIQDSPIENAGGVFITLTIGKGY